MTREQEQKLFTTLGYIKKGVEDNSALIRKQNGALARLNKKVQAHEVFIGKIGVVVASITFMVTAGVNIAIVAWTKFWHS